ncbi:NYN domain-containing protein [Arthrobacter sp. NEB 688]|uniref:NYN domain-containing protein n=1 Tax=Arthrobacter sp. NEB 688 TaxID=904039 RepID=UPI0015662ADB|nr:NYN domain-containing protein [Arthrobacter sp. NEB 688]QKE82572.1 NYN domain-containing protein [Arthrobacter sp. NEB 688]
MTDDARIALLIDADNARARRLDVILNELAGLGETTIRRAYGNWTKSELKGWQEILHENAIRPMQQFDPSKGKNASDMALAVDAVEILHTQRPDAFAIVSSDSDFTPLVMHLREHGVAVYGFGDSKTPAPFQSACTRFLVLDRLSAPSGQADATEAPDAPDTVETAEAAAPEPATGRAPRRATKKATTAGRATVATVGGEDAAEAPRKTATKAAKAPAKTARASAKNGNPPPERATRAQLRGDNRLVALLRRAVESAADDSGWAKIGTVGQRISNQSSFDSRNYGYAKLSKLLEASELFEIRDGGSPDMAVRDPRAG